MPIAIIVPRLGWSMDEGVFVGWLKKDGDAVRAGEPLFTLEGDKAAQEIEAVDSGILRIPPNAPKAGDTVTVGTPLGYLMGETESVAPADAGRSGLSQDAEERSAAPVGAVIGVATATASAGQGELGPAPGEVIISPRARRRAEELGVDYRRLKGSGSSGRIVEEDVLAAARQERAPGPATMRRTIAQRTADSSARVPHFHLTTEVDATALLALRARLLPQIEQAVGIRLTLTDLLLRAQAMALRDCPRANAIWLDNQVAHFSACDVGLVVGLDDGLLVPILRAADSRGLAELAQQRRSLVEAARAGQLPPEATQGGATSLSNLGTTVVDEFAAVIAPSHSSMLAVGRAAARPFVVDGQLAVRVTLKLCLAVDHRVLDGGPAAGFLGRIVDRIERPAALAGE
jgi:pyruvate dehydrogenase E2 component (dihydrolipoamide acetyltransferase)